MDECEHTHLSGNATLKKLPNYRTTTATSYSFVPSSLGADLKINQGDVSFFQITDQTAVAQKQNEGVWDVCESWVYRRLEATLLLQSLGANCLDRRTECMAGLQATHSCRTTAHSSGARWPFTTLEFHLKKQRNYKCMVCYYTCLNMPIEVCHGDANGLLFRPAAWKNPQRKPDQCRLVFIHRLRLSLHQQQRIPDHKHYRDRNSDFTVSFAQIYLTVCIWNGLIPSR